MLAGLVIADSLRRREGFVMASNGMDIAEKIAMCIGIYAIGKTALQVRQYGAVTNLYAVLRSHVGEGIRGLRARTLLIARWNVHGLG